MMVDFDSAILAARFCDGGEAVNGEDSVRLPLTLNEPASQPFPFEIVTAAIGAAAGLITAAFYGWPLIF